MKSAKGLIGLLAFAICLWVVAACAAQAKLAAKTGSEILPVPMQGVPCPPPPPPPPPAE